MADEEGDYLPVGGGRLFCEVAGAGRPEIVLTHDGLLHRETWDAQFSTFARDYRVARWDRRGYGLSDQPEAAYSSADDLAQVARFVSDAPVTLVGCSFGALVSLHCALEHPELVAALVLVGPIVSGLDLSEHALTRGGRGLPAREAPVAEQIAYWSEIDPWFVAPTNIGARHRLRELLEANPHNLQVKAGLDRTSAQPALTRLGQLSMPTLIVVGEEDSPDVHAHSGAIAAGVAGARRVVLTGSGHLPQMEVPDAFNATVLRFLTDLAPNAADLKSNA